MYHGITYHQYFYSISFYQYLFIWKKYNGITIVLLLSQYCRSFYQYFFPFKNGIADIYTC